MAFSLGVQIRMSETKRHVAGQQFWATGYYELVVRKYIEKAAGQPSDQMNL
jgi:hypothetical protein